MDLPALYSNKTLRTADGVTFEELAEFPGRSGFTSNLSTVHNLQGELPLGYKSCSVFIDDDTLMVIGGSYTFPDGDSDYFRQGYSINNIQICKKRRRQGVCDTAPCG